MMELIFKKSQQNSIQKKSTEVPNSSAIAYIAKNRQVALF